jgi:hypothetical protein
VRVNLRHQRTTCRESTGTTSYWTQATPYISIQVRRIAIAEGGAPCARPLLWWRLHEFAVHAGFSRSGMRKRCAAGRPAANRPYTVGSRSTLPQARPPPALVTGRRRVLSISSRGTPALPPGEKAAARQDQTRQSSTGDGGQERVQVAIRECERSLLDQNTDYGRRPRRPQKTTCQVPLAEECPEIFRRRSTDRTIRCTSHWVLHQENR